MSDVHSTGALRICRDDGRCQYAIDHGAEGLGHCSPKCVMPSDQAGALRNEPEAAVRDRELLELAALAAGIELVWEGNTDVFAAPFEEPWCWVRSPGPKNRRAGDGAAWNPLLDDGDALRLANKLWLEVRHVHGKAHVGVSRRFWCTEPWFPDGDQDAATRRAIVRAAAQIGSELRKAASGSHQEARSDEQGERSLTPLETNLVATLRLLDERLRQCIEIPASAADAYDSHYQAEVAAALEGATGEST